MYTVYMVYSYNYKNDIVLLNHIFVAVVYFGTDGLRIWAGSKPDNHDLGR